MYNVLQTWYLVSAFLLKKTRKQALDHHLVITLRRSPTFGYGWLIKTQTDSKAAPNAQVERGRERAARESSPACHHHLPCDDEDADGSELRHLPMYIGVCVCVCVCVCVPTHHTHTNTHTRVKCRREREREKEREREDILRLVPVPSHAAHPQRHPDHYPPLQNCRRQISWPHALGS
jgi:hypothetical protein